MERTFSPFTNRSRTYGKLPSDLAQEIDRFFPTDMGGMVAYPVAAELKDGRIVDNVYVAEASSYKRVWGVWPEDDPGKNSIPIEDVATFFPSPNRLPPVLARSIYEKGETAMGGTTL